MAGRRGYRALRLIATAASTIDPQVLFPQLASMPLIYPKVSLILLAYRQEKYVGAAVESALDQDYPNLEILLSDDCSPDGTFGIMDELARAYSGPHSVHIFKTPTNLGTARHLQGLVDRAGGDLLVLAAGDDNSAPERTRRLVDAWLAAGAGPAMLYSDYRPLNLAGELLAGRSQVVRASPPTFREACRGELEVHGATSAVTPSLFRDFAPISSEVVFEDRVLPFRALLLGGSVIYVDVPLVDYRIAGGISRSPDDAAQAPEFELKTIERKLADARQRLADVVAKRSSDTKALRACRATILDHQARLAFGRGSSLLHEVRLLRWLAAGARVSRTVKSYVRYRLLSLGLLGLFGRR